MKRSFLISRDGPGLRRNLLIPERIQQPKDPTYLSKNLIVGEDFMEGIIRAEKLC